MYYGKDVEANLLVGTNVTLTMYVPIWELVVGAILTTLLVIVPESGM